MTKEIKLNAEIRKNLDKKTEKIDQKKSIMAVIYGPGAENKNLKIKRLEFEQIYKIAGESNLINLTIENNPTLKVLVKDIQKDPIKGTITHVDLYQVDMSKKITTEIPLDFVGESKAVKDLGLVLVKSIDSVDVECLPNDLVDHIDVDISKLANDGDVIKISDLNIPAGMIVLHHHNDDIVANVVELSIEEETPAPVVVETEAATTAQAAEAETKKEE
jgi:large subunit ribosomal protein L25